MGIVVSPGGSKPLAQQRQSRVQSAGEDVQASQPAGRGAKFNALGMVGRCRESKEEMCRALQVCDAGGAAEKPCRVFGRPRHATSCLRSHCLRIPLPPSRSP